MGSCQAVFPQSELLQVVCLDLPAECCLCSMTRQNFTFCRVPFDFSLSRALESLILSSLHPFASLSEMLV